MMPPPKYKRLFKKTQSPRAGFIISHLKRENAFLLKTLNELAHHHSEHNRIIEKFLSLVSLRPSTNDHEIKDTGSMTASLPVELSSHEEKLSDVVSMRRLSCYFKEIEEVKDKLVSISARCQFLESKVAREQESAAVQDSDASVTELQMKLKDAIEKNKQWVEYDQQREAYVKSILARMSWLEKHLNEASNACAVERNDHRSSGELHRHTELEKKKIKQVKQYYEGLMQKANEESDILREQVCLIQQALTKALNECREKQCEVVELQQQLQSEWSDRDPLNHQQIQEDEAYLTNEAEHLQGRLDKERRKSATLELQSGHLQKYFQNHYHKAQEQIAKLKRKLEISSQDLHDERENCFYLKQQLELLQKLPKDKEIAEKAHNLGQSSAGPSDRPPLPPKNTQPLSPHRCVLEDSFLECPNCHLGYPASDYKDLLEHLERC